MKEKNQKKRKRKFLLNQCLFLNFEFNKQSYCSIRKRIKVYINGKSDCVRFYFVISFFFSLFLM